MIPKIAAGGSSFKGCAKYYLHDKGKTTRERVAWTHTENMLTDDPDKAWRVMAYTAKEAERLKAASGQAKVGRKLTKPVFSFSLAWHPEQKPDKDHMLEIAKKSIAHLGLDEYQALIVAHRDEPQPHCHVILCRVHPLTGLACDIGNSKLKLSDFAREYEREHGKIYCPQREENHRKRKRGEKVMYSDPHIVAAWENSKNGQEFAVALKAKGYQIANGRKRVVIIDPYGQTHNPTRHLKDIRTKQFTERIQDLRLERFPDATKLAQKVQADNRRRYEESLRHDKKVTREKSQTQSRHQEQESRMTDGFRDRLAREKEEVKLHYQLDEQQAQIDALRHNVQNSTWWQRLLRITKRSQMRLTELELSHQNGERRAQEHLDKITAERDASITRLKKEQDLETKRLCDQFQRQQPPGYMNEDEREKLTQIIKAKKEKSRDPLDQSRDFE